MKEGNAIASFLSLIGAHHSYLEFENVRVLKDMRNQVNRVVNCETANLNKVVKAAVRQLAAIRTIDRTVGLDQLPENLQEAARLRLKHQDLAVGGTCSADGRPYWKIGSESSAEEIGTDCGKIGKEARE